MKKQLLFALFLSFSILTSSCGTTFRGANSLDCKIDGEKYKPTDVTSSTISDYIILATLNRSQNLSITLPIDISPGDYDLTNNSQIIVKYLDYNRITYFASSGTLSITKVNSDKKEIYGEFDLSLFSSVNGETLQATDGDFKVSY